MSEYIGIIGAMESEVKGLIAKIENCQLSRVGGLDFYSGRLYGKDVVVAQCGVGKVFAAMCAEAMIIKYAPRLIINTGVGGALADGLKCTDIVVAKRLVQHDMDTSAIGDPKGLVSGINKVYFDADERAGEILISEAEKIGIYATYGTVASGDIFVADKQLKENIKQQFGASVCEMEGAAIAQTAYVNSTPFAVVRAISDSADGDSPMSFAEFLCEAVKSSERLTEALIREY